MPTQGATEIAKEMLASFSKQMLEYIDLSPAVLVAVSAAASVNIDMSRVRNCDTPVSKDEIALPGCTPR